MKKPKFPNHWKGPSFLNYVTIKEREEKELELTKESVRGEIK